MPISHVTSTLPFGGMDGTVNSQIRSESGRKAPNSWALTRPGAGCVASASGFSKTSVNKTV